MSLNSAQREAAVHHLGPCLVLAGPGSGKTLTIVKRIETLIKTYHVKPEEILVITFTKYAAKEMRERFYRLMPGKHLPVTFGTFHGIYYGILKWAYRLGPKNLMSEEEKHQLLRQISGKYELDALEDRDLMRDLAAEIGIIKNSRLNPETYESSVCPPELFRRIYADYERLRKQQHKIDFDDMLTLCCNLFESRADLLAKWQEKFRYILIDEFQDINQVQYDVIKMLAAPQNNLFAVGDDDQSIYGFRGAKSALMFQFEQDYPEARRIVLNVNYRSTANIVRCAKRVIENNRERYKKQIRPSRPSGKRVHIQETADSEEEARYLVEQIRMRLTDGAVPEQIAVLFRTKNDSRAITEELSRMGIPFWMREQIPNLYAHFIGENLGSYFRLAMGQWSRKEFLGIMNHPNRYISRESLNTETFTLESLRNFYCDKEWMLDRIDRLDADLRMIRDMTPYGAIQYIRKSIGYDGFLKEYAAKNVKSAEELFDILHEIEDQARVYRTLEQWLEHVKEYTELLKRQKENMEQNKGIGVQLMTLHSAKGLEFETVFLPGVYEGGIPYRKMRTPGELEEERRLFYVGMTRAKSELIISYAKTKNGKERIPSRFVNEIYSVSRSPNS